MTIVEASLDAEGGTTEILKIFRVDRENSSVDPIFRGLVRRNGKDRYSSLNECRVPWPRLYGRILMCGLTSSTITHILP